MLVLRWNLCCLLRCWYGGKKYCNQEYHTARHVGVRYHLSFNVLFKIFFFGDESHVLKRKLHQNQGTQVTIYLEFVALFDIKCLFMKLILEIAHKLWIYCYCHIDAKEIYAKLIHKFWATILDFDAFILNTTTYKICNIHLCILNRIYFSSFQYVFSRKYISNHRMTTNKIYSFKFH